MMDELILTSSDGEVPLDDDVLEQLKKDEKDYQQRELSPAEKRCDFELIKNIYDKDSIVVINRLIGILKQTRDNLLPLIQRRGESGFSADFAQHTRFDSGREFSRALEDFLLQVWRKNRDASMSELPEKVQKETQLLKKFANAFRPDVAENWFRNRALAISGLVDDELSSAVKMELFEHLKGGRTLNETMGNLRSLMEPWIGTGAFEPSGISDTEEDILRPYRLENIIRTETATAVSQGRAMVADAANDFILGYELSAILDERTTEICDLADGIRFRTGDPRANKLMPPLHYQCRTVPIFITTEDEPVDWSNEDELDEVVRIIMPGFK